MLGPTLQAAQLTIAILLFVNDAYVCDYDCIILAAIKKGTENRLQ